MKSMLVVAKARGGEPESVACTHFAHACMCVRLILSRTRVPGPSIHPVLHLNPPQDFHAMAHLSAQFKARAVARSYLAIAAGCPASERGRVCAAIGRDPVHRKRMAVLSASARQKTRHAASR